MGKLFVVVILFLGIVCASFAAVGRSRPSTHPDYPGKCWLKSSETAYEIGSHYPEGACKKINCHKDFSLAFFSCGTVGAPEGFHLESDETKHYPECCPYIAKD